MVQGKVTGGMTTEQSGTASNTFIDVSKLRSGGELEFDLSLNADEVTQLISDLGVTDFRKLRFNGRVRPVGKSDWQLDATLGVTVEQPCSVTLEPVNTRIDEKVQRLYLATPPDIPDAAETEMDEDTTEEYLGDGIDLLALVRESISLALPLYPRAENAALDQNTFAPPGATPLEDDDVKPFAGLASLRDKLKKGR